MSKRLKKGDVVWYTVLDRELDEVDSCQRQSELHDAEKFRRELRRADRELPLNAWHSGPYRIAKLVLA